MTPSFETIQSICRNAIWGVVLALLLFPASAFGQIDGRMTYQGFLSGSDGDPVDTVGFNLRFALFPSSNGVPTPLWTEEHTVDVAAGLFSVILGTDDPLTESVFSIPVSMELTVLGPDGDDVLAPRIPVTPTPQSIRAKFSEEAGLSLRAVTADTAERIGSGAIAAGCDPSDVWFITPA